MPERPIMQAYAQAGNWLSQPLQWLQDALGLFFPRYCVGCGISLPDPHAPICVRCIADMPATDFERWAANPVEKLFWGRLPLAAACSGFYFSRGSSVQSMIHHLKYLDSPELGVFLGRMLGDRIRDSGRFGNTDALIPLPLYPEKQRLRGYNQAERIAAGMAEMLGVPVLENAVVRIRQSASQTRKNRTERWQQMSGSFLVHPERLDAYRHLLLVDDVVTTGATLEACGAAIRARCSAVLYVATLAYADC
jgi:ComF family protein